MPIIDTLLNQSAPLSQGDILKGVSLFATANDPKGGSGLARDVRQDLCLVVSRPCVALRKEKVVVVAVTPYTINKPSEFGDFEEAKEFYTDIRDGLSEPDYFYLGQMPGYTGSFCARFDGFHTIDIPKRAEERAAFIAAKRIASLSGDFARDLHLRIFRVFASLGFDDHRWFPDEDLKAIVIYGQKDIKAIETEILGVEGQLQAGNSQSFSKESDKKRLEGELERLNKKLAKAKSDVKPYEDEKARREQFTIGDREPQP